MQLSRTQPYAQRRFRGYQNTGANDFSLHALRRDRSLSQRREQDKYERLRGDAQRYYYSDEESE